MAQNLSVHYPILPVSTKSGNQPAMQAFLESSGLNVNYGTPLTINGSGQSAVWSGTPSYGPPGNLLGFIATHGKNLGSAGLGAAPPFGSIGPPWGQGAVQDVVNQANAYSVYHGAPFVDGTSTVYLATQDTIFEGQVDASSGGTYNATTSLIGTSVGLTSDGNGWWYWDLAKTTVGTNAVGVVVSLNPLDYVVGSTTTQVNNGRIRVALAAAIIAVTQ